MKLKLIVFTLFTFLIGESAFAQITITQGSIAPIGSAYRDYAPLNTVTISAGPAGANQTWTIPEQTYSAPGVYNYVSPASTPFANLFPGATHASSDGSGYYSYTRVAANGFYFMGFVVAPDTVVIQNVYDPQGLVAPLPLSYPHAGWTYLTRATSEPFPGFFVTFTDSTLNTLDAWGTINTQFGSFQVLRVLQHSYNIAQITGLPPTITESTSYIWVTEQGLPVVSMNNEDGWNPNFTTAYINMTMPGTAAADPVRGPVAKNFNVQQNFPNPFNPTTSIPVELTQSGEVTLKIYNETGQLISEESMTMTAGAHTIPVNASTWASGNYFANISQHDAAQTIRMNLVK